MSGLKAPDAATRWRCSQCGNLTRFDVVRTTRLKQYWHVDLSGEPAVDSEEVLADVLESVTCRWCGSGTAIEMVARPEPVGLDPGSPS
jgi:hypothetical protein